MMPSLLCLSLLIPFLPQKGDDIKIMTRHDFRFFGEKMFGDYDRKWSWFFRVGGEVWMVEYHPYALRVGYNIDSILREGDGGGTPLYQVRYTISPQILLLRKPYNFALTYNHRCWHSADIQDLNLESWNTVGFSFAPRITVSRRASVWFHLAPEVVVQRGDVRYDASTLSEAELRLHFCRLFTLVVSTSWRWVRCDAPHKPNGRNYFWLWRQAICLLFKTHSGKVGFYAAYEYLEELEGYRGGADHFLSAGICFLF